MMRSGLIGTAGGMLLGLAMIAGTATADTLDDMGDLYFSLVAGHEIADRCANLGDTEAKLFRRAIDQLSEDIRKIGRRMSDEDRATEKLRQGPIANKARAFVDGHGCMSAKVRDAAASWQELLVMFPYRPQYFGMAREGMASPQP